MTRIIASVGPRTKRLRAANQEGAAKSHVSILSLRSPKPVVADPSQVRAVPSLLSHRHLVRFLSTMRPYRSLSCNMRARRFLFPTIPTRRTLSVTIVTSLDFIFFMSDIPLIVSFVGLRNWRSGGTATRCRCSPRKYYSGRTHAQCCTSRSSALISLSTYDCECCSMTPRFFKLLKTRLTFSRATPAMAARSFPLIRWSSRMRPRPASLPI